MVEVPKELQKSEFRFCLVQKSHKNPFEQEWQSKNNYAYDNDILKNHINDSGNFGIIGGYGNLLIIDFDNKEFEEKYAPYLPETFTVKTGSGGTHLYYLCDDCPSFKILDNNKNTLADIQGRGKQVIVPESTHPNGNKYTILKNIPIKKITLKEIKITFSEYLKEKDKFKSNYIQDDIIQKIKDNISLNTLLSGYGYDLTKNPTMCKLGHASKSQKCFSWNDNEGLWYCHHCGEGGDIFNLVMSHDNCDFPTAKKKLMDLANIKSDKITRAKSNNLTLEEVKEKIIDIITNEDISDKDSLITETIVSYILSSKYIHTIRSDEKEEIWIYNNGIYIPEGATYIKEITREILNKLYCTSKINRILLKIQADTYIQSKDFFLEEDVNLIAVNNGILNIKTKELTNFSPKYKFFNKIPVNYNCSSNCDKIITFLKEVTSDQSDIDTLQELFGYLLYRHYEIEKAIMLTGGGRNGKSKTIEIMKRFIGAVNCANIPIQALESDQFAMGELFNKLANLSADISKTALKETGKFKSLIGRDLISAQRKFLPMVHFQNYAKMIFSANELPVTQDITPAFFLRWVIIDFPYTFLSEKELLQVQDNEKDRFKLANPNIIEEITSDDQMSGLLNWSLIGLNRLLSKKDFSYNKSNIEVKNTWLRKSSSIHAFIMDCVVRKSDSKVPKQEFLEAYLDYCSTHKITSVNERQIKDTLETTIGCTEFRPDIEGERVNCWRGIILK